MSSETDLLARPLPGVDRVLGTVGEPGKGPTLICVGGLHGNEPAGILAMERVLAALEGREQALSGSLVALVGNRAALAERRRFLVRDLNRAWTREHIAAIRVPGAERCSEDEEQLELLDTLDRVLSEAGDAALFLDLHTTSGPGKPFSTTMDSAAGRRFALGIPAPVVIGFEELVEGTLLGYLDERGVPGVVFEGGKHDGPGSIEASMAGIWLALSRAGILDEAVVPEVREARTLLLRATRDLPPALELRYRHPVAPGDGFEMLPGLRSFQPVWEGEVLARDKKGEIRSPEGGLLLLPLYQPQGEDGFFLIREVDPSRLVLSG